MGVFAFSDAYYENDEPSEIESVDEQRNFDIDSDTFDANLGAEAGAEKFGVGRTLNFGGTREEYSPISAPRRVLQSTNLKFLRGE